MKLYIALFACAALIPGALSFKNPCKEGLIYCGSTLQKWHGYTEAELVAAIAANLDALLKPGDALFQCKDSEGGIQLYSFCYLGCTQPPNGDICASS